MNKDAMSKEEEKKVTNRINELYHKKEKEGLTPETISDILSELKANQRERLHIQTEKIRRSKRYY